MAKMKAASWDELSALRDRVQASLTGGATLTQASQQFVDTVHQTFPAIVLARLFVVMRLDRLPASEQTWATEFAARAGRQVPLPPQTPVLCLCGTAGKEVAWNDRTRSTGHRAIPFVDKELVDGAPMLAALLGSLGIELASPPHSSGIELRQVSGSLYKSFYVPDAREAKDEAGRRIIPSDEFVQRYAVRTVFGMGGSYVGGEMAIAIFFTAEELSALDVGRWPSLIGTFKMATAAHVEKGRFA